MNPRKATFFVLIVLVISICGMAGGAEKKEVSSMAQERVPNFFDLRGMGIEVTYSTTSLSGEPQLTFQDRKRTLVFQGDEIRNADSEIGQQVTVTLEQIPDLQTVTLTLILPEIHLEGNEILFQTHAVLTTHRTSIGGPDLIKGALQTYHLKTLKGTARFVTYE